MTPGCGTSETKSQVKRIEWDESAKTFILTIHQEGHDTMFKKFVMLIMASMLVFSFTVPTLVEAKSSYKAPRKSYTPTNQQKAPSNNVSKNEPSNSTSKTPGTASPATKPGFFSGGLMKGLLIGGMAGLLFGGLFGGMGALGNILGLLVNVLAIVALVAVIMKVVSFFRQRRKLNQDQER